MANELAAMAMLPKGYEVGRGRSERSSEHSQMEDVYKEIVESYVQKAKQDA